GRRQRRVPRLQSDGAARSEYNRDVRHHYHGIATCLARM
ncbi:MAG: hypothetical protein AVDCRST_MAG87-693, partial [uncultured Thermomicrobiales bacterium]